MRSLGGSTAAVLEFFATAAWTRLVASYFRHLATDRGQFKLHILTVVAHFAIAARAPTDSLRTPPRDWPR